ncbi:hypothetical protein GCM10020258_06890 [Sphingomonas yabuuchiae]
MRVPRLTVASASGGRLAFAGGYGLAYDARGLRIDTRAAMGGGGLPSLRATLQQDGPKQPMRGTAELARYEAGGAALAFDRMVFRSAVNGETQVTTRVALSGPISGGRIDGLVLPIAARWDGGRRLLINPDCQPLAIDRLALSGLRLAKVATRLCPLDGALVRLDGTRLSGGAQLGATRLVGQIGSSPLTLAAATTRFALADRSFTLTGVQTVIGRPESPTRIDAAELNGRITSEGLAGQFTGGAGQVGQVPLLLGEAGGDWRLAGGVLTLNGALQVRDARADSPRFLPMAARDVTLTLAGSRIDARGTLFEPTKSVKVADVAITHALDKGAGAADLSVPGITFTKDFQPELLTPVTKGVIEDVRGPINGRGRIVWDANGVRSTGRFGTDGIDLAAALGPVSGIAGTIDFTDLLALESAPGQVATVKTINPGIQVTNGVIRYQTLSGARVRVESGRWPFAGGMLTLDPTLLDFSQPVERRMTFHVEGGGGPVPAPVRLQESECHRRLRRHPADDLRRAGRADRGRSAGRARRRRQHRLSRRIESEGSGRLGQSGVRGVALAQLSVLADRHERAAGGRDGDRCALRRDQPGHGRQVQLHHPAAPAPALHLQRADQGALSRAARFGAVLLRSAPSDPAQPARAAGRTEQARRAACESRRHLHSAIRKRDRAMTVTGLKTLGRMPILDATRWMPVALTLLSGGCVNISAPEKPIEINLNINVTQEVVYRLDGEAKSLIQQNPGIF